MTFCLKSCWWYSFQTGRFQSSFCRRRSIRILKNRIKFWREISDFCLLLSPGPGQRSPVSWQVRAQRSVKHLSFCRPALVCKRSSVCSVVERHFKNRNEKSQKASDKSETTEKSERFENWRLKIVKISTDDRIYLRDDSVSMTISDFSQQGMYKWRFDEFLVSLF